MRHLYTILQHGSHLPNFLHHVQYNTYVVWLYDLSNSLMGKLGNSSSINEIFTEASQYGACNRGDLLCELQ
jgi:hypothetical protein